MPSTALETGSVYWQFRGCDAQHSNITIARGSLGVDTMLVHHSLGHSARASRIRIRFSSVVANFCHCSALRRASSAMS